MQETIWDSLDEDSARLLRAALDEADTEAGSQAENIEIGQRASALTDEIKSNSSPEELLKFNQELTAYLDAARERKFQAQELQASIQLKLSQIDEAELEIVQLSAFRPALAKAVNHSAIKYEEAQNEYGLNDFKIATLEDRISMRRGEILSLRRQLTELKNKGS